MAVIEQIHLAKEGLLYRGARGHYGERVRMALSSCSGQFVVCERDVSLLCLNSNGKPQVKVLRLDCRMSFVAPKGDFTQTGIWSGKGKGKLETGASLVRRDREGGWSSMGG